MRNDLGFGFPIVVPKYDYSIQLLLFHMFGQKSPCWKVNVNFNKSFFLVIYVAYVLHKIGKFI